MFRLMTFLPIKRLLPFFLSVLFFYQSFATEPSEDRTKVEFFERLYGVQIEGIQPLETYKDPDSFYAAIAKKVGIPNKALAALEEKYGWKQGGDHLLSAVVKGGPIGDHWGVMVTKVPMALKDAQTKEQRMTLLKKMEMKFVVIGYDGSISFPKESGNERQKKESSTKTKKD